MISLFAPSDGLQFSELQYLPKLSYFTDLNLDKFTEHMKALEISEELIPYFYYVPKTKEEADYRQEIVKDLSDPDIRAAISRFITGIGIAERYYGYSDKVNTSVQKWKWRLDTIVRFYSAIERFCVDLNESGPKSKAFHDVHQYLYDLLKSKEVMEIRGKAEEINAEFDKMRFHMTINKERATLDFQYSEEDYCSEIRSAFPHAEETASDEHVFTESPFGDMNISPLEEFILNQFIKQDKILFRNLETFCGVQKEILIPDVLNLIRELRFYLFNLEYFEKMKGHGFPFAFPELREDRDICLIDCYDIVLAAKNYEIKQEVILNDIVKSDTETAIIVTGPNQGGKTTLARAFGQCCYFGMMGFPVAAASARLPFFDRIFTQFASITGNGVEGRLEHELIGVNEILKEQTENSLIIFNELFTSAPTVDALTMCRNLLKRLLSKNAVCFVVTHTFELSFDSEDYVSLVATVVEDGSFRRTYRIVRKPADGVAYANSIVGKYKLDYDHIRGRLAKR